MDSGWLKPKWLLRRRAAALLAKADRDPSPTNVEAVQRWREEHRRHAAALQSGENVLRQATRLSGSRIGRGTPAAPDEQGRFRPVVALAASLALAMLGGAAIYIATRANEQIEAVLLTTDVGEIRQIPLSDGTKLTLDTASAVRVEIAAKHRQAILDHGRARFAVSKQSVPFTIRTANTTIHLEEGVVDVINEDGAHSIALIAGSAQLAKNDIQKREPMMVKAPASVDASGAVLPTLAGERNTDWPTGRLSFERARLEDVVAEANRYTNNQILLGHPSLAGMKVTVVFRAGDAEGLARSLAAGLGLRADRDQKGNLILRPKSRPR